MNYRHAFHAGNFADVVKHVVMTRILARLAEKPTPFRVLDTHAGAGLYALDGPQASRTAEWRDGIGRLHDVEPPPEVAALLAPYRAAVDAVNPPGVLTRYPGSPLVALAVMRPQDRLVACELEPDAVAALTRSLARDRRAKAVAIDGWTALGAFLPPKERRGLVLIDPPFERPDEFSRLSHAIVKAVRKWRTGVYLIWYPIKDRRGPDELARALAGPGFEDVLRIEIEIGRDLDGLAASGLIVVNPPWRLAEELGTVFTWLGPRLARREGAGVRIDRGPFG